MIYPEPERNKRNAKLKNSTLLFDKALLSQARTVLKYAPESF